MSCVRGADDRDRRAKGGGVICVQSLKAMLEMLEQALEQE
jgi:hypothetical protein